VAAVWHLLAAFAPIAYGPLEIGLFLITFYAILQFGLVLGYHRLLSHRSFSTHRLITRGLGLMGVFAMQNGPISWVAMHRAHHQIADQEFDPHTPQHGVGWAHLMWTFFEHPKLSNSAEKIALGPDLYRDPFLRFCEEKFILLNAAATGFVFLLGVGVGGISRGFSFLVWIVGVRTVLLWHITFLTNSLGHIRGYRNFETFDNSRNVPLLGILALGDGWHNNHHACPACAAHGRRWFEVDLTYRLIGICEGLGLVWNVRHAGPPLSNSRSSGQIEKARSNSKSKKEAASEFH
jgi:stearoyl-CoA desaturase (delta-9 desaturase)